MINKKLNLSLKLNNSFSSLGGADQPFTPLEQTMKTPIDQPMLMHTPQHHPNHGPNNNGGAMDYFPRNDSTSSINSHSLYQNPHYNESDDILTDIDEPLFGSFKTTKNYTVNFNQNFDQLLLSSYQYFLGLPTTTPFLGTIPPSGLVSKVSNDTMNKLIQSTSSTTSVPPSFDYQNLVSHDFLRNHSYKPIFLQLIRKRLIDLCTCHHSGLPLPQSTSITITVTSGGGNGMPFTTTTTASSNNNSSGMPPNIRQSSISNLSLTELNISNYNALNGSKNLAAATAALDNRSRSSSISLRKQSLTRNNSSSGNNWLHVGNLNTIKPEMHHSKFSAMHNDNVSTDSLQSIQDFVPQSFINKSSMNPSTTANNTHNASGNANANSLHPSVSNSNGFNSMMMDYQTPPSSQKGSISHQITPPSLSASSHQIFNSGNENMVDEFNFYLTRSRSSSRGTSLPKALHINTEHGVPKNGSFSSASSINGASDTLDSPFMSSSKTSEDCGYFTNGFPVNSNVAHSPMYDNDNSSISSASSTGSLRGTGIATVVNGTSGTATLTTVTNSPGTNGYASNNTTASSNMAASSSNGPSSAATNKDSINLPSQFSLSEKKRDSLKLKRGIH